MRVRSTIFRIFKLLYLLVLIIFLLWTFQGYLKIAQGYEGLWSCVSRVDPLSAPLHHPLVLLECNVRSGQLIVRLLRTYAAPEAEDLTIVVEIHSSRGDTTRMDVRKRVALGTQVLFMFPLSFSAEQLTSYRVEAYVNGKLVAAWQGE